MATTDCYLINLDSLSDTRRFCAVLARQLSAGQIVLLSGEIAVGKTTFVREITRQLASTDRVTSPTYAIGHLYKAGDGSTLLHIDLYRLNSVAEFLDTGLQDFFEQSIVLIEWGELLSDWLQAYWHLNLSRKSASEQARDVSVSCKGPMASAQVQALQASFATQNWRASE